MSFIVSGPGSYQVQGIYHVVVINAGLGEGRVWYNGETYVALSGHATYEAFYPLALDGQLKVSDGVTVRLVALDNLGLAPSDLGQDHYPLGPNTWFPEPVPEEEWAAQNRKINDLIAGRSC